MPAPKPRRHRKSPRPPRGPQVKSAPSQAADAPAAPPERLQKVLAAAGVGSRRQCEEIILGGRVEVDGQTVTELGTKVDPANQRIVVDGVQLKRPRLAYYAVYKPEGVVSTNADPDGRPRVIDLLPEHAERVFSVGRLDRASEGLMLLTNDGALAQALTHPKFGVAKTYEVIVAGKLEPETIKRLLRGVHLAEGIARVSDLRVKSQRPKSALVRMVLREGRNREIRRILARVGHKALKIKRVGIAGLKLGTLKPGQFRRLLPVEVRDLRQVAARATKPRDPAAAHEPRSTSPAAPPRPRKAKPPRKKPAAATPREHAAGAAPGRPTGPRPRRPFRPRREKRPL